MLPSSGWLPPWSLVVKNCKSPQIRGEKKAPVQFGSVPPYSLVVKKCTKPAIQFGSVRPPYSLVEVLPWPLR